MLNTSTCLQIAQRQAPITSFVAWAQALPPLHVFAGGFEAQILLWQVAIPWAAFLAATRGLDFLKILTVGALPTRWQHQVPEIALVLWLVFYVASAVVARCALSMY